MLHEENERGRERGGSRCLFNGVTLLPAADADLASLSPSLPLLLPLRRTQTDRNPPAAPDRDTMTETKTHVILLSCGSFNPITRGHLHMFGERGRGTRDEQ